MMLSMLNPYRLAPVGGGGGTGAIVQTKVVLSGSTTSHSVTFDSSVTAGNLVVCIFYAAPAVSAMATTGDVSSIGSADVSTDISSFGDIFQAWHRSNVPSGVTGFSFTTASATYINICAVEISGLGASASFDASGVATATFTDTPSVSVTTTADNGAMLAWWATNTLSTNNSGWTNVGTSGDILQYHTGALGAAGSKTAGMTLTAAGGGNRGLGVAYKA